MIALKNNSNHCYHGFSTDCMPGTELRLAHIEARILIGENNYLNSKKHSTCIKKKYFLAVSTGDKVYLFPLELLKR